MQNQPNNEPNFDEIGMPQEAQTEDTDSVLGKEVLGERGVFDFKDGSGTIGELELYEWFRLMQEEHETPKWKTYAIVTEHVDVPDKRARQVLDMLYGFSGGYDVPIDDDPGWTWGEFGKFMLDSGIDVSSPKFVEDFFHTAWSSVKGLRHLPGIVKGVGSDMFKEGYWTAELWDIINEKDKNAQRAKWKRYQKNYPTISQIFADYPRRYGSPRKLRQANIENSWDQISDALMFIPEPTSKVAGALGKYRSISKIRKFVPDPTDISGRLIGTGLSQVAVPYAKRLAEKYPNLMRWGMHKKHYNPDVEIITKELPSGESVTVTKPVLDIAEDMEIAKQDMLPSVKSTSKSVTKREAGVAKNSPEGKKILEDMAGEMEAGIKQTQQRTVNELGVVNPYDTDTVAERVYQSIEAHQSDISVDLRKKYKTVHGKELMDQTIQFADEGITDPIATTRAFLESRKPKNIKNSEYEKIVQVFDDLILEGGKIETVDDLNRFRTQFREAITEAYRDKGISKIGKGSLVDGVNQHLIDDLHKSLMETVGQPLLNDVTAAHAAMKKAMEDRYSNAGQFIYSKTNLADPVKMIDGLLDGKLSSEADITKFYEMVGPAAKREIQAALVARIFQRALDENNNWKPTGLSDVLKSVSGKKNASQLDILLGNDAVAESLTFKIYEISEFSRMMDRVRNVKDSHKTAYIMHALSSIGAAVVGAKSSDFLKSLGFAGDVVEGAFIFGSSFIAKRGLEFAKNALGEKRFVKALKDPEFMDRFLQGVPGEERIAAVSDWFEKQRNLYGVTMQVDRALERIEPEIEEQKKKAKRPKPRLPGGGYGNDRLFVE